MSHETVGLIVSRLREWGRFTKRLTVLWHAGEPLILPPSFYDTVVRQFQDLSGPDTEIQHSIQTNATLVTKEHCSVLRTRNFNVGVSIDGPKEAHDAFRTTRGGAGTFDAAVSGLKRLQAEGLRPAVIAVLSSLSMREPDAFYDCFAELNVPLVGLNIQEREAASLVSISDDSKATKELYEHFLRRVFLRSLEDDSLIFREFMSVVDIIEAGVPITDNSEASPGAILSFSDDGSFSTFSPELLGVKTIQYGTFIHGHVMEGSIAEKLSSVIQDRIGQDISDGIERCRTACQYFSFCGGGSPANKLGENGCFHSAETSHCRFTKQSLVDVVASLLEDPGVRMKALGQLRRWRDHRAV